jgi:hypothetical protein
MIRAMILTGALAFLLPAGAAAQLNESRCADCHFANPDAPGERHLQEWERSAHGRERVGCERCHGGDSTTFERLPAHLGILTSRNPASPVHRENLPVTCGRCHTGPYVAFQKSRHLELLRAGDPFGPTCSTCHGEVGAELLSPRGIATQCSRCHGEGKVAVRPEYPVQARLMLEGIREVRTQLSAARRLIGDVKDQARRDQLMYQYEQAEVPLVEATNAGHEFVYTNLQERLDLARRRTAALYVNVVGAR